MNSEQILKKTLLPLLFIIQLLTFSFTANAQQKAIKALSFVGGDNVNNGDTSVFSIFVSSTDTIHDAVVSIDILYPNLIKVLKVTPKDGTYNSSSWQLPAKSLGSQIDFKYIVNNSVQSCIELDIHSNDNDSTIYPNSSILCIYAGNFPPDKIGDLSLTNNVSDIKIVNGNEYTYTVEVENKGDSIAPNVKVYAAFPSELTLKYNNASKGYYRKDAGIWDIGTLEPQAKETLILRGKLNQLKAVQFCAEITTSEKDIDQSNNYSCVNLGVKNIPIPYPGNIAGKAVLDVDSNCVSNTNDIAQNNELILLTDSANTTYYTFTDSLGNYSTDVPYGKYSVRSVASTNKATSCPIGGIVNCNITSANSNFSSANFYQNYLPLITDLVVSQSSNNFRPGFNADVVVYCFNKGTSTVNTTLQYIKDPAVTFVSANTQPLVMRGDTIVFDLNNLKPDSTTYFHMVFNTQQSTLLGTGLKFIANLSATNDVTPKNNVDTLEEIVAGSYDPNKITVNQGRYIDGSNDELIYRIDFQNTGTYYAQNVLVVDSIEHNLDVSTIHLLGQSHPGLQLSLNAEKNKLDFAFDNILLPDSNMNEKGSHGYVIYSIKMKHGLSVGTTIKNRGYIYFDFNNAIITNQAENTIVSNSTGIGNIQNSKSGVIVFPNPVINGYLTVDSKDALINAEFYNIIGEKVLESKTNHIDVSALPKGLYLLKINTKSSQSVKKIAIE